MIQLKYLYKDKDETISLNINSSKARVSLSTQDLIPIEKLNLW